MDNQLMPFPQVLNMSTVQKIVSDHGILFFPQINSFKVIIFDTLRLIFCQDFTATEHKNYIHIGHRALIQLLHCDKLCYKYQKQQQQQQKHAH